MTPMTLWLFFLLVGFSEGFSSVSYNWAPPPSLFKPRQRSLMRLKAAADEQSSGQAQSVESQAELAFVDANTQVTKPVVKLSPTARFGARTAALSRNEAGDEDGDGHTDSADDDDAAECDDEGTVLAVEREISQIYNTQSFKGRSDKDGDVVNSSGKEEEEEGGEWDFIDQKRTFDDLSDAEYQKVMDVALDEEHKQTLSRKVEAVMEQDWDVQQGVAQSLPSKPLPAKANLDLSTYHARQALVVRGNFTEAQEIYQRCIEYNPVDGRAWLGLARIYQKKGVYAEAERCFKDGLYYNPKNPYLMQGWAVMLEKQGKVAQAIKLLRGSVIANPRHSASWVALGQIQQRRGRSDEARFCLRSAVDGDPRSYVALQAWGVLESNAGNLNEARSLFKRALKQSRNSVHTLQAWATLERKQGNLESAEKLLRRALKEWPKSTRARVGLAEIKELRGDVNEARRAFELGEKMAAKCGDAGFFQSWALFEARVAAAGLAKSKDIDGDQSGYTNSGSSAMHYEPLPEAKAAQIRNLFTRGVKVNKYHSATWIAWAKFEQHSGNPDVARRLLTEGVNYFPHSKNIAWFHTALGNLAWHREDVITARACYARALDSTSPKKSLSILLEWAKMEERMGSRAGSEARALYEKAVVKFPREERVWNAYIDFERRKERVLPIAKSTRNGDDSGSGRVGVDAGADDADANKPNRMSNKAAAAAPPPQQQLKRGRDKDQADNPQLYNPGGAVNVLMQRRKELSNMAIGPKLVKDTAWESSSAEFEGI